MSPPPIRLRVTPPIGEPFDHLCESDSLTVGRSSKAGDFVTGGQDTIGLRVPSHPVAQAMLKAFGGDWSFLTEVVEVFFSDYPIQIETLLRSAGSGEAAAFRRAAHSLKGMLRNFQAETAAAKAFELEKKGQAGELAETEPLIDALGQDLKQLEQELRDVLKRKMPKMP